ncbi:GAF and ANTAR domain-containing protein [Arthrobacter gengyunqii]|uniref:GAF and ANTAR domain-containing protein n=1 Tax=Arthrobacter gengyunqii TaxID=2886940 RepID=A0A9X1M4H7_9MICC|nr:GAF and ANTAR domain-containing protein [Arthrobacter gengyunqii]MCC3270782.1 GAF and ANTAR domain-containing protein [Arthrobacter gengyunqii]UOY96520.1 GAF and ANTAR domain-containing protein [Arthrobacter gengyunqii]
MSSDNFSARLPSAGDGSKHSAAETTELIDAARAAQAETGKDYSGLLQDMLLETSDVEGFLEDLTRLTVDTLAAPGQELFSGVTLLRPGSAGTVASDSEESRRMDEVQYRFGTGPCLEAARTNSTVVVRDITTDPRWDEYAKAIAGYGLKSILGVPIPLDNDARCGLNVYAREPDAFTDEMIRAAEEFARGASKSLRLAMRITQLDESRENLKAAMGSRTTIDLAVGIIMAQNRCSQEAAIGILKAASSARNVKLRDIAASVVASVGEKEPKTHFVD